VNRRKKTEVVETKATPISLPISLKDPKAKILAKDTQPGNIYYKGIYIIKVMQVHEDRVMVQCFAPSATNSYPVPPDYGFHGELSNGDIAEFISKLPTYMQMFYLGGSEETKERKRQRRENKKALKKLKREKMDVAFNKGRQEAKPYKDGEGKTGQGEEPEEEKTPREIVRNESGETVSSIITTMIKEGKHTREEIAKEVKKSFADMDDKKIQARIKLKIYKLGAKEVGDKLRLD
jgi:hypothetical protein